MDSRCLSEQNRRISWRQLRASNDKDNSIGLVLGSSAWDILLHEDQHRPDSNFTDHFQAVRDYVRAVQQKYPHVTLYGNPARRCMSIITTKGHVGGPFAKNA